MISLRAIFDDSPVVLFHYAPGRSYDELECWLKPALQGFTGVICSDEYPSYQKLSNAYPSIQARGACWVHARRKFVDAVKGRRHGSEAHGAIKAIAALYKLEGQCSVHRKRREKRLALIRPWLERFKTRLDSLRPHYPDSGLMHRAIGYTLNNWEALFRFVDHPDLPIDNNPVENAIRPFCVGRRNWLYTGSPRVHTPAHSCIPWWKRQKRMVGSRRPTWPRCSSATRAIFRVARDASKAVRFLLDEPVAQAAAGYLELLWRLANCLVGRRPTSILVKLERLSQRICGTAR